MKYLVYILSLLILASLASGSTINVTDDARVSEGNGAVNYGTDPYLYTISKPADNHFAYIGLDLSSLKSLYVSVMNLSLFTDSLNGLTADVQNKFFYCNDTFNEGTITWNNRAAEVINCNVTEFYNWTHSSHVAETRYNIDLLNVFNYDADGIFTIKIEVDPMDHVTDAVRYYTKDEVNTAKHPYVSYSNTSSSSIVQITLNSPANYSNITTSSVVFNWTVISNSSPSVNCNLTLDNIVIKADKSCNNATACTYSHSVNSSMHYWNVSCFDNHSVTYWLNATFVSTQIFIYDEETEKSIRVKNGSNSTQGTVSLILINEGVTQFEYNTTSGNLSLTGIPTGEYEIQFDAEGYNKRKRTIDIDATANTTTINLYLLNSTNSVNSIIRLIDENRIPVESAVIKIQREYGSEFIEVNELLTNIEGESDSGFIRYDVNYRFLVYVNDVLLQTTEKTLIFKDTITIQAAITEDQLLTIKQYLNATGDVTLSNVSGVMTFTYIWAGANVKGARLTIIKSILSSNDIIHSVNESSASVGTMTLKFTPDSSYTYSAIGEIDTNTTGSFYITDTEEYKRSSAIKVFGLLGMLLAVIIIGSIAALRAEHPSASIITALLGLVAISLIGLVQISYGFIVMLIAIGAIIVFSNKT